MASLAEPLDREISGSLRRNFLVNILDGGFFGMALGFASFVTVVPLFVRQMTSSAILIGLIPAIHSMGWQLPQLFTANLVARQSRFKPLVLFMTIHERIPFLGLAVLAWFLPRARIEIILPLTYAMLIWQGLGGGFTATAWTSLIGKLIPTDRRGTFFGFQSAAANLLASISAIWAGVILERQESSEGYALCFLLAGISMILSMLFLALNKEPKHPILEPEVGKVASLKNLLSILRRDVNFIWFVVVRMISQFAVMAYAFYTVYAVSRLGMSVATAGIMTAVMTASQILTNPIMGWLGDRWSHRAVMTMGILAASCSALLAWWAPTVSWFYAVFFLAGISNVAIWTIGLAMILEFGNLTDRPAYIGLGNTLVAPATILAPILGGLLADRSGYPAAFLASAIAGFGAAILLQALFRDPRRKQSPAANVADPVYTKISAHSSEIIEEE